MTAKVSSELHETMLELRKEEIRDFVRLRMADKVRQYADPAKQARDMEEEDKAAEQVRASPFCRMGEPPSDCHDADGN